MNQMFLSNIDMRVISIILFKYCKMSKNKQLAETINKFAKIK